MKTKNTNKSPRNYYAIAHTYGQSTLNESGQYLGICVRFPSKAEREAWIDEGPSYLSDPGVRVAYTAKELSADHKKYSLTLAQYEAL